MVLTCSASSSRSSTDSDRFARTQQRHRDRVEYAIGRFAAFASEYEGCRGSASASMARSERDALKAVFDASE